MSACIPKSLGEKTWRGQSGRVRVGKSGGGNCYGYDVVRGPSNAGELERGGRCVGASGLGRTWISSLIPLVLLIVA